MSGPSVQEKNPTRVVSRRTIFPLVRHLSGRVTPVLANLPITANQITTAALVCGLVGAWLMTRQIQSAAVGGAVFLIVYYVLDNCDGEIARLKGESSEFGRKFDTFVDWVVHAAFFAALGWGVSLRNGTEIWLWLGLVAAAGATINYLLVLATDHNEKTNPQRVQPDSEGLAVKRPSLGSWFIYAYRELARADFCFVVLLLACFDLLLLLLPLAALGAQVYWLTLIIAKAKGYDV